LQQVRLRLVEEETTRPATDTAAAVIGAADRAVDALHEVDPSALDGTELRSWLEGLERLRRSIDAAAIAATGAIDRSNPFRAQGFLSAKSAIKHMCRLSGPEAHRRVQAARLHEALPAWAEAAADGKVGVAQTRLMARIAANPDISAGLLERDAPALLDDAERLPHDEFERRARTWESLADADGADRAHERRTARRNVEVRPQPGGGWTLSGSLADLDGAEFNEIFAWFIEAEWQSDWAEARERKGDDATTADLRRTEPQRRADALLAMARAAASTPPGSKRPRTTLDVLVDRATFEATVAGERRDPADYADVTIRTRSGRQLHPRDAIRAAIVGHVRRVVYDTDGTVIDLGRRSRLFRGSARDAVMLLALTCIWTGCDLPGDWCDADHSVGWKAHGATVPRNGGPLCGRHNNLKERGFEVYRDRHGEWHVFDPDGNEIR
jgi:hypothetical protein